MPPYANKPFLILRVLFLTGQLYSMMQKIISRQSTLLNDKNYKLYIHIGKNHALNQLIRVISTNLTTLIDN
jgi:hypothetical protein